MLFWRKKKEVDYAKLYNLTPEEKEEFQVRIGTRISEGLTEEQLAEFDSITQPEKAKVFLQKYVPNYAEIVAEERERILNERMK